MAKLHKRRHQEIHGGNGQDGDAMVDMEDLLPQQEPELLKPLVKEMGRRLQAVGAVLGV